MEVHRGEVFYADLSPVVGSEQGGVRPVLIVQNEIGNRHSPTVIAAAITSRLDKTRLPTHINIRAADTGLAKDSVVLLEQIRTLDKHRLRQRAGQITPEDQKRGQPGPGRQPWAGQRHLTPKMPRPAGGAFFSVSKNDTLQGEPISARSRGTEIPSPWYPPGDKIWR